MRVLTKAYTLSYKGEKNEAKPRLRGTELEPETFQLEQLQDIVGGYIEIVNLTDDVIMVINEEGKLNELPINLEATALFRRCFPKSEDFIVGNVLVCDSTMVE